MKTIQLEIVQRFMDEKDFKDFLQEYADHCHHSRRIKNPSEKDLRIAKMFHESKSASEVAKKLGLNSSYAVISAVGRVYAHKK